MLTLDISPEDAHTIGEKALHSITTVYGEFFNPFHFTVEVALVDLETIAAINEEHRAIAEPTDVLSFPLYEKENLVSGEGIPDGGLIGSIVICPEKAVQYDETLPQLVHHGLLHVAGYDHETDWTAWHEREIDLIERYAGHNLAIPPVSL